MNNHESCTYILLLQWTNYRISNNLHYGHYAWDFLKTLRKRYKDIYCRLIIISLTFTDIVISRIMTSLGSTISPLNPPRWNTRSMIDKGIPFREHVSAISLCLSESLLLSAFHTPWIYDNTTKAYKFPFMACENIERNIEMFKMD